MGVKQGVLCNDRRCADGKLPIFGSKIYFVFVKVLSCTAHAVFMSDSRHKSLKNLEDCF